MYHVLDFLERWWVCGEKFRRPRGRFHLWEGTNRIRAFLITIETREVVESFLFRKVGFTTKLLLEERLAKSPRIATELPLLKRILAGELFVSERGLGGNVDA